jgi:hypothetical protein
MKNIKKKMTILDMNKKVRKFPRFNVTLIVPLRRGGQLAKGVQKAGAELEAHTGKSVSEKASGIMAGHNLKGSENTGHPSSKLTHSPSHIERPTIDPVEFPGQEEKQHEESRNADYNSSDGNEYGNTQDFLGNDDNAALVISGVGLGLASYQVLTDNSKAIETKWDNVETKVNNVETKVNNVETKVNNIEKMIKGVLERFSEIYNENIELKQENIELKQENIELKQKNSELKQENSELKQILNQKIEAESGNIKDAQNPLVQAVEREEKLIKDIVKGFGKIYEVKQILNQKIEAESRNIKDAQNPFAQAVEREEKLIKDVLERFSKIYKVKQILNQKIEVESGNVKKAQNLFAQVVERTINQHKATEPKANVPEENKKEGGKIIIEEKHEIAD